jgi:hypothetical protein
LATAAPAVNAAQVGVSIRAPGIRIVTGRYYNGGRYYKYRKWECAVRYGRRVCAYRYWEPIVIAGPPPRAGAYYWRGRHWGHRRWECNRRNNRRACAFRYW